MTRCLKWDPKTRLTPEKALEHPFITEVTFSLAPSLVRATHPLFHSATSSAIPLSFRPFAHTPGLLFCYCV